MSIRRCYRSRESLNGAIPFPSRASLAVSTAVNYPVLISFWLRFQCADSGRLCAWDVRAWFARMAVFFVAFSMRAWCAHSIARAGMCAGLLRPQIAQKSNCKLRFAGRLLRITFICEGDVPRGVVADSIKRRKNITWVRLCTYQGLLQQAP